MKVIAPERILAEKRGFVQARCEIIWRGRSTLVLDVSGNAFPAFEKPVRCISYLDEYIILCPMQKLVEHKIFWEDIVNYLAPDYSRLIKHEVNSACLVEMFRLAETAGVAIDGSLVVDFGCGDGIIQTALIGYQPRGVIGVERNNWQRQQAQAAGLEVVSRWQDINHPVDLIVGCYAVHMGCAQELFGLASRWLRPGGVVLANCYKNIGIEHVSVAEFCGVLDIMIVPRFAAGRGPLFLAKRHAD